MAFLEADDSVHSAPHFRSRQVQALGAHAKPVRRSASSLWASIGQSLGCGSTCDRCESRMLDFRARGTERICIACVDAECAALSRPTTCAELVGCAAAMRAILAELHCVATAGPGPRDADQIGALVETAQALAWWMTPPSLREPGALSINKNAVIHLLARYEATWGRVIGKVSIAGTFQFWMLRQATAQQQSKHADNDRH